MRRHGWRAVGFRERTIEVGHRFIGISIKHVEHGDRSDEAVIIAATDRRVEEEMPGLFEAGQCTEISNPPLDVGMPRLPVIGLHAIGEQDGISRKEAC